MKETQTQLLTVRKPRQPRARHKVELILEAAIRLLDKGGLPMLTTNAVADTAGVSIGTIYQYFPNKEAILEALADREIAVLSARVLAVLDAPPRSGPLRKAPMPASSSRSAGRDVASGARVRAANSRGQAVSSSARATASRER